MEIEMKKFKARQAEMWAEIRQEREAFQIKKDKVIDSGNKENLVIGKAESSSIYSESIKSKEASIIEKGHEKHSKTTIIDFSKVNGTYVATGFPGINSQKMALVLIRPRITVS